MKVNYPYLNDAEFLKLADKQRLQTQHIKLTLLDWDENPIQEIQGIATSGTISLNGSSAIRRTCSLNMTVDEIAETAITSVKNLISINKKLFLEIGIVNRTNKYPEYPILWYPQGTFVFTSCNLSSGIGQGYSLSAQLKDKMCLLNGECGGTFTSSVVLDQYDTLNPATGEIYTTKNTISQIIRELVNHFGKVPLNKIIINDIDEKIKMTMRWAGDTPLYLAQKDSSFLYTTSYAEAIAYGGNIKIFQYGADCGFTFTDFVYPSELIANIGDNICGVLDKIKNLLGNYEYYFDIDGNFIFQEIKNYLNTTQATIDLQNMKNEDYKIDIAKGKSVYDFKDAELITSYSTNPNYNNIKNDYVVWGIKENTDKIKLPIRYHLAIDTKPKTGNIYQVYVYYDFVDGITKMKAPTHFQNRASFPTIGNAELLYLDEETNYVYRWDINLHAYVAPEGSPYETYNAGNPGLSGIIYLDSNTNQRYVWTINPNSQHYQDTMATINNINNVYETNIQPDVDAIASLQSERDGYVTQLLQLEETYKTDLALEKTYARQIENLSHQEQTPEIQAKIAQLEAQKTALHNGALAPYYEAKDEIDEEILDIDAEILTHQNSINAYSTIRDTDVAYYTARLGEYQPYVENNFIMVQTTDWRSELYLSGVTADALGLDRNYYYAELAAEWPKLYNFQASSYTDDDGNTIYTGDFTDEVKNNPWSVDYWLDFIDSESAIGGLSVDNIGRRSMTKSSDDYNCVFESEIPDLVLIKEDTETTDAEREACEKRGQDYCQVEASIYDLLVMGGWANSCFNEIKNLLWENTSYNTSINLSLIPIYHLEPNTRITVQSVENDIHGDYMMNSLSIPLTYNGTMSISATQVQTKL